MAGAFLTDHEIRIRWADGDYRWYNRTVFGDGDVVVAYGHDVEDRETGEAALAAAEEQLRRSQKPETIGQLTGGVARDFNNLLIPVSSSLEVLRKRLPDGDDGARDLLDNARKGVERGISPTRRMLSFARRQDLDATAVDVAGLIEGMRDLPVRSLGPQVILRVDVADGVDPALIDANQLEMAIPNLAVNARDAVGGRRDPRRPRRGRPRGGDGDAAADPEPAYACASWMTAPAWMRRRWRRRWSRSSPRKEWEGARGWVCR
jgi:signal transduction histidine kinase